MKKEKIKTTNDAEICEAEVVSPEVSDIEIKTNSTSAQFKKYFRCEPFPLTARKLERLVCRIDSHGPLQLGAFYHARLRHECTLLLSYPVMGFNEYLLGVFMNWSNNSNFFYCAAIGEILKIYYYMGEEYVTLHNIEK